MVRLSFAVRPPPGVRALVEDARPPAMDGVTWTDPQRWLVKLRPLGHVPAELHGPLVEAAEAALDGAPTAEARLGPMRRRYGGQALCVPVEGVDELSEAIFEATAPIVPVTHPQPFHAELFVAGGRIPRGLDHIPLAGAWPVTEVLLIADHSSPKRVRLEDIAAIPLGL